MFGGTYTALVTPFKSDKSIDWPAFSRLVRAQIKAGVEGIVLAGLTGEAPTLDDDEYMEVIAHAVKIAQGKIKLIASAESNSTRDAVRLASQAEKAGADALLLAAPFYNRPTQDGICHHFLEIARHTHVPILLHNNPARSGVEIAGDTVQRLAAGAARFIGLVESGGDLGRATQLRAALGKKFVILSGHDAFTVPFMALGVHGVVSVAANLIPRPICQMVRAAAAGDYAKARQWHDRYHPLFHDLSLVPNPVPVKAALAMTGQIEEQYRTPLFPMNPSNRDLLKTTLVRYRLLP